MSKYNNLIGKKVLIIGSPASGKTTLGMKLKGSGFEVIHTDDFMQYGFKDSLYKLLDSIKDKSNFIIEGVLGYRLLRKGLELGTYLPDVVIQIDADIDTIKNRYEKRGKKDFNSVLSMIKSNEKILNEYLSMAIVKPEWIKLRQEESSQFMLDIKGENMIKNLDSTNFEKGTGWVLVFPRGKHFINKYNMVLNCDDKFFSSIKDWWENSTFKKPYLDKGHEFNEQYGKFSEMRITDKGLELFLTLNDDGINMVKSGKYNYLSPMFQDSKDSTGQAYKNVIYSVSLVNSPALLQLDELQNQIALSIDGEIKNDKTKKGGSRMELRELAAMKLSLSPAADDGSILAKIEELINSGATIEDLKSKIEIMKAEMDKVSEELSAEKEEKEKALSALAVIQKKYLEDEAKATIDLAIKEGQYHPAIKELKVAQFIENKDLVLKELSVIPKTKKDSQMTANSKVELEISEEDKAILLDAGIDISKPEGMEEARKILDVIGGKK